MQSPTITLTPDRLIAVITLTKDRSGSGTVSAPALAQQLKAQGFACSLSTASLENSVWAFLKSEAKDTRITLMADALVLGRQAVQIRLEAGEMEARAELSVPAALAGQLSPALLERLLRAAGVIYGIDPAALEAVAAQFASGPGVALDVLLARGQPEVMAADGRIEAGPDLVHPVTVSRPERSGGRAALTGKSSGSGLPAGSLLASQFFPRPGQEGRSVTGKVLWSPGNRRTILEPKIQKGRHLEETHLDDRIEYRSQVAGRALLFDNYLLDVEEALPGDFELTVSEDRLQAELHLQAPRYGAPLSLEDLQTALDRSGLKLGMIEDSLRAALDEANQRNDGSESRLILAQGRPPVNGRDGAITWSTRLEPFRQPVVGPDGVIDYRGGNRQPLIRQGQAIARVRPPSPGLAPGEDVYGEAIPPQDGRAAEALFSDQFDISEGSDEQGAVQTVTAKTAGLLFRKAGVYALEPVLVLNQVDYESGDIDFEGPVLIKGTVLDGFSVRAGKDLHVGQAVGACRLESATRIHLPGGMNGRDKGSVKAPLVLMKFAENCRVEGGELNFESHVLRCSLRASQSIRVGLNRRPGLVIGSRLQAWGDITLSEVTGELSTDETELWLGVDGMAYDTHAELGRQIERLRVDLDHLAKLTAGAVKNPEALKDLAQRRQDLETALEGLSQDRQALGERLYNPQSPRLSCLGTLKAHTRLRFGAVEKTLRSEAVKRAFVLTDDGITEQPLKGPPPPSPQTPASG